MATEGKGTNLELRVGRLEGAVQGLVADVKDIVNGMDSLTGNLNSFQKEVITALGETKTPKWSMIISLGSLIVAIFTLIGGIMAIVMNGQSAATIKLEQIVDKTRQELIDGKFQDGVNFAWKENIVKQTEDFHKEIVDIQQWKMLHIERDAEIKGKIMAEIEFLKQFEKRYFNKEK
jgi:hypothetical protein